MFDCTRERRAPGFTGNFSKKSNPPGFRWLTLKLKSFSKVSADSSKTTLTFQLDPCGSAHSQEQLSRKPLHTRTKATNSNRAKIESFRLHVPSMPLLRSNPFISLPYNLQLLLCCESFLNSSVCQLPIVLGPAAGISTRSSSEVSASATREPRPKAMATKATPERH